MPKVDASDDNIRRCRCPICPVQSNSECAKKRLETVNNETPIDVFNLEEAAMLYCSIGISDCKDLDTKENCMCPTCEVWEKYDLQSMYYCLHGSADEIN